MCTGISVLGDSLSTEGAEYEAANGQSILNLGEVMTVGNAAAKRITFQVADVHKPLLSITTCADMGFDCFFDRKGGRLRDRLAHEMIPLDRKGTLFTMRMWVRYELLLHRIPKQKSLLQLRPLSPRPNCTKSMCLGTRT